jgi:hypothetical protein
MTMAVLRCCIMQAGLRRSGHEFKAECVAGTAVAIKAPFHI